MGDKITTPNISILNLIVKMSAEDSPNKEDTTETNIEEEDPTESPTHLIGTHGNGSRGKIEELQLFISRVSI